MGVPAAVERCKGGGPVKGGKEGREGQEGHHYGQPLGEHQGGTGLHGGGNVQGVPQPGDTVEQEPGHLEVDRYDIYAAIGAITLRYISVYALYDLN